LRTSLGVDVIALSLAVHLAGGVDNVSLPLLYPAVISLAGLLLTRADTFAVAILCALSYDAVVYAEHAGLLAHLVPYSRPLHRHVATVIPVNVFLVLYAWLVSFATERIRAFYQRTEELRRDAIRALSHDLKNPLSVIHGYARLLPSAPPAEKARFSNGIERTAQQALDLVSNVLDAAAFEGRPITPRPHAVQLNELVGDVADRYRQLAAAARVQLVTELNGDVAPAEVDGQLIARAVGNLISNAIKYTPAGGGVRITTSARDGRLFVRVADTGAGVSAEELPLLFQRYSRASSARTSRARGSASTSCAASPRLTTAA
jgi:signal transduction histidine kinase